MAKVEIESDYLLRIEPTQEEIGKMIDEIRKDFYPNHTLKQFAREVLYTIEYPLKAYSIGHLKHLCQKAGLKLDIIVHR